MVILNFQLISGSRLARVNATKEKILLDIVVKPEIIQIIIESDEKGYHGFVPLLRGVHTAGKTIEETKKNLNEAIRCHLEGLLKDNITPHILPKKSEEEPFKQ